MSALSPSSQMPKLHYPGGCVTFAHCEAAAGIMPSLSSRGGSEQRMKYICPIHC